MRQTDPSSCAGGRSSIPARVDPRSLMFEHSLTGKCALVTGAFGGLGRHFALTLATAGASVALAGRRMNVGQKVAAEIRAAGGRASIHAMDVTDPESVRAAIEDAAGE